MPLTSNEKEVFLIHDPVSDQMLPVRACTEEQLIKSGELHAAAYTKAVKAIAQAIDAAEQLRNMMTVLRYELDTRARVILT